MSFKRRERMEASMGYINYRYPQKGLMAVLLAAMLIFGCAGKEPAQKDSIETWAAKADTSKGHCLRPGSE